jgi:hypothetical protein
MDSSHSAGSRLRLDLLIPILAFLIAVSFSPLKLLACCTFPSIKPKLIRGVWRPAMASLDLDLCSLITISDHLVLITLEESTKTSRDNIYCRRRSYKLAPISTAFSCVRHYPPLGNSVTVLPEKHQPLSQITQWCSAHLLLVWAPVKGQRHACRTMLMIGIMSQ